MTYVSVLGFSCSNLAFTDGLMDWEILSRFKQLILLDAITEASFHDQTTVVEAAITSPGWYCRAWSN